MVRAASRNPGLPVRQMLFSELDEDERYDGIFACASILHVPSAELPDILKKMKKAVKQNGILYISFKYGTFEGIRNGRYFTDLTEDSLQEILDEVGGLEAGRIWITQDARPGREEERWINILHVASQNRLCLLQSIGYTELRTYVGRIVLCYCFQRFWI